MAPLSQLEHCRRSAGSAGLEESPGSFSDGSLQPAQGRGKVERNVWLPPALTTQIHAKQGETNVIQQGRPAEQQGTQQWEDEHEISEDCLNFDVGNSEVRIKVRGWGEVTSNLHSVLSSFQP